jgi:hypothetical protein
MLMMLQGDVIPEGEVLVISTHIFGSERLWTDTPAPMGDAVLLHNSLIRDVTFSAGHLLSAL